MRKSSKLQKDKTRQPKDSQASATASRYLHYSVRASARVHKKIGKVGTAASESWSSSSSAPPPRPTRTRNLTLTEHVKRLEVQTAQYYSYQIECNKAFEQMFVACASLLGVNMASFPTLPQPPTNFEFKEEED